MIFRYILATLILIVMIFMPWFTRTDVSLTENGIITIHLDEYNGYFAAKETLLDLKSGIYDFVITNKADKLVGFWLQDANSKAFLD